MKKILLILALTLSLNAWENGKIVTVIDGDTMMLKKQNGKVVKVRLVGLDTFETKMNHRVFKQLETLKNIHPREKHTVSDVLRLGWDAHRFVKKRVLGKKVQYHSYKLDIYDRELVYLKDINFLLIRNGLAVQYPNNLLHPKRKAFLLEASKQAHLERRGIYARGGK